MMSCGPCSMRTLHLLSNLILMLSGCKSAIELYNSISGGGGQVRA